MHKEECFVTVCDECAENLIRRLLAYIFFFAEYVITIFFFFQAYRLSISTSIERAYKALHCCWMHASQLDGQSMFFHNIARLIILIRVNVNRP
jgi:hypothetical protein